MSSQFYRYDFAIFCCLFVSLAASAGQTFAARPTPIHPLSYTEAWITISDQIEVKLRLFTDDIIRYDNESESLPETLSADRFNRMLDRQTPELLRRLQLYGGGELLTGKVISAPDPWTNGNTIDVVGSANVKHTWSFQFQIPPRPLRSLTLRHSLSPPGIEQLGELRLHSRHKPWKQRIDAVIPPDLAYTLVYQEAGNSNAATATANQTTSRIVVTPFAITHEVTLPLTTVLTAFPNPDANVHNAGHEKTDVVPISRQQQLSQQLNEWIRQNTILESQGELISKRMSIVEFFESGIIPEQPLPDAKPTPLLAPGTLVGIRQTYARPRSMNAGTLTLKSAFLGISEIRCETIANNAASTSLQQIESTPAEGQILHFWVTPVSEVSARPDDGLPAIVSQNLILQTMPSGRLTAWSLMIAGLAFTLFWIPFRRRPPASSNQAKSTAIIAVGLAMLVAGFAVMPAIQYQAQPTKLQHWMSAALKTIYQSLQAPSEQQTVDRLSQWLSDDLVESTYLTLCQQMAAEPKQATWTGIQTVKLSNMDVQMEHPKSLRVLCEWQVEGLAYHWGHAHHVTRSYSGQFLLGKSVADWKIQELRQLEAAASTSER